MTHTSTEQPEALRFAEMYDFGYLVEDTDPDDEAFDDFAEDVEDNECISCSGTGEGMYDSQSCVVCLGKGFL